MSAENKQYLGDAVYADIEQGMILLTTEDNGPHPSNRIYLEPAVAHALVDYIRTHMNIE